METINNIELSNENIFPDDIVLSSILNNSFNTYKKLLELFEKHDLNYTWRYYKDGKAWLCKVQRKNKTIAWMSAWRDFMQVTLYFPDKYIDNLYKLDINENIKKISLSKKKVGKSSPCIFEIRDKSILEDLEKVILYKIQCK